MKSRSLLQLALLLPVSISMSASHAQSVPITAGMDYGVARQQLILAGWNSQNRSKPATPDDSWMPYSNMDQQISLTDYFRKKGWRETLICAPTGLGLSDLKFFSANGSGLIVITTMGHQSKPPVVHSYKYGDGKRWQSLKLLQIYA
jgi:hypothetical protein